MAYLYNDDAIPYNTPDDREDIYIGNITSREALAIISAAHLRPDKDLDRLHYQIIQSVHEKLHSQAAQCAKFETDNAGLRQQLAEYTVSEQRVKKQLGITIDTFSQDNNNE